MKSFFTLLIVFINFCATAQFTYRLHQDVEVEVDGKMLTLPWAGGLNSVQVNTIDLNGDNKQDLALFDRTANKLIAFLNQNNQFVAAPEYEELFPTEITQWMLLRDFNCDGKKDIFTSDPFGIIVFVNTTGADGKLKWRSFNPGFPLLTKGFSGNINLKINESDIPAIDDVDGDGDLDILNMRFVGIGSIEWHKNLSQERTGTCDSLQLERSTQNFGNFEECGCGIFAFGKTCAELEGGRTQHAGGKALLSIDLDNDGDRELLASEEDCARVYLLENKGTKDNALMTTAARFPISSPINFLNFPAVFFEDVDFDGLRDLVSSPNLYARNFLNVDFKNSMWLYKNTGSNQLPQFVFQKRDFLQEEMIDVGDYAVPALIDADGDFDLDLFISSYANADFAGTTTFFENTGTATVPKFKFITDDYLNFSTATFYNVKIQFADVNNDGTLDFAFTGTTRQGGVTALHYAPNKSNNGLDFGGQSVITTPIKIAQTENILLVDVNQDGLTDFLLGKTNGAVEYWKNEGPAGSLNYRLQNESYLGLGPNTERQNPALSTGDLDADGQADLILTDQKGFLSIYKNFRATELATAPMRDLVFNELTETYKPKNLGGGVWPVIANLFRTDRPAIIVGNTLGGIHILKNDKSKELPESPVIDLYPNPVDEGKFKIKTDRDMAVQFYTMLGIKISEPYFILANQVYPFTLSGLLPGTYIASFSIKGKTIGRKFIVL